MWRASLHASYPALVEKWLISRPLSQRPSEYKSMTRWRRLSKNDREAGKAGDRNQMIRTLKTWAKGEENRNGHASSAQRFWSSRTQKTAEHSAGVFSTFTSRFPLSDGLHNCSVLWIVTLPLAWFSFFFSFLCVLFSGLLTTATVAQICKLECGFLFECLLAVKKRLSQHWCFWETGRSGLVNHSV